MINDITLDDVINWLGNQEDEREIDQARELLMDIANGSYSPEELRDEILQYKEDIHVDREKDNER